MPTQCECTHTAAATPDEGTWATRRGRRCHAEFGEVGDCRVHGHRGCYRPRQAVGRRAQPPRIHSLKRARRNARHVCDCGRVPEGRRFSAEEPARANVCDDGTESLQAYANDGGLSAEPVPRAVIGCLEAQAQPHGGESGVARPPRVVPRKTRHVCELGVRDGHAYGVRDRPRLHLCVLDETRVDAETGRIRRRPACRAQPVGCEVEDGAIRGRPGRSRGRRGRRLPELGDCAVRGVEQDEVTVAPASGRRAAHHGALDGCARRHRKESHAARRVAFVWVQRVRHGHQRRPLGASADRGNGNAVQDRLASRQRGTPSKVRVQVTTRSDRSKSRGGGRMHGQAVHARIHGVRRGERRARAVSVAADRSKIRVGGVCSRGSRCGARRGARVGRRGIGWWDLRRLPRAHLTGGRLQARELHATLYATGESRKHTSSISGDAAAADAMTMLFAKVTLRAGGKTCDHGVSS